MKSLRLIVCCIVAMAIVAGCSRKSAVSPASVSHEDQYVANLHRRLADAPQGSPAEIQIVFSSWLSVEEARAVLEGIQSLKINYVDVLIQCTGRKLRALMPASGLTDTAFHDAILDRLTYKAKYASDENNAIFKAALENTECVRIDAVRATALPSEIRDWWNSKPAIVRFVQLYTEDGLASLVIFEPGVVMP